MDSAILLLSWTRILRDDGTMNMMDAIAHF